ncbi:hypothetical protein GCM10010967_48080 [Dyadobacter beijingensis]|uniref:Uncharacterized protein n=1 Tax=Dyadobacter beijingensis TaxID=365489 RepID=A0ABQ2IFS1_9BACT|nr:hypothetical protein [Dyadobacter beijingensis]GGN07038.1 hypothetical protein GCM10010967_48080 [Dyadobacter beijingensis]
MDSLKFFDMVSWGFYLSCNAMAIFLIWASKSRPALARLILLLIFLFAAGFNAYTALDAPWNYQDFADSAMPIYKRFILGAFLHIITPMVLTIAICQLLIALAMTARGQLFQAGCWAGMIFLVAIAPLGLYAAFPMPLLLASSMLRLIRTESGRPANPKSVKLKTKHHARHIPN